MTSQLHSSVSYEQVREFAPSYGKRELSFLNSLRWVIHDADGLTYLVQRIYRDFAGSGNGWALYRDEEQREHEKGGKMCDCDPERARVGVWGRRGRVSG